MMTHRLVWVLLAAFALQQPSSETGTITGRVVDASVGAPLARALVTVRDARVRTVQRITDEDGRFEFAGLAPGTYDISASAGQFRATHVVYPNGTRMTLRIQAGDRRDVPIALTAAVAISGRVLDQAGFPLTRVGIRLKELATGRTIFNPGRSDTDDRGAFRIFGLAPGRYLVCAQTDASPSFDPAAAVPSARFVQTCYPSALEESTAQPVTVRGGDVDGLEIRMLRSRTFTVSGQVVDATGASPDSFELNLTRIQKDGGASGSGSRVQGHSFILCNVVPGRYAIGANLGPDPSPSSRPTEMGLVHIDVISDDITNLLITTKKAATVRGIVTFEGGVPAELKIGQIRVDPQSADPGWMSGFTRNVPVTEDLTFTLSDLFGPKVLHTAGLPAGMAVRSVLYRGQDIRDRGVEFTTDPRDVVEIVVTPRVAELTGRAMNDRGEAAAGARVHVFPSDPTRWRSSAHRTARATKAGIYRIRTLAPGDYLIVALSEQDQLDITGGDWFRLDRSERLAKIADRVSLLESDRRTLDLRLTPIPQEWKR